MKNLIYFILCLLVLSCDSSKDEEPEWGIFKISKATYKEKSIIGSTNYFKEVFNNPTSRKDSCLSIGIYPHGGHYWIYDCVTSKKEPNITYASLGNTVFLHSVNFISSNEKIISPELILNNQTTLDDIKNAIPKAYATLNKYNSLSIPEGYDWLHVNDDLSSERRNSPNYIQLWFKDNRLTNFFYYWTPEMTVEQIEKTKEIYRKNDEPLKEKKN